MTYRLNEQDIQNFFTKDEILLPNDKGSISPSMVQIDENITLCKTAYTLKDDICFIHEKHDHDALCLNILLQGEMLIDEKISKQQESLKPLYSSLHLARCMQGNAYIKKNQTVHRLSLFFNTKYVKKYLPNIDISRTKSLKYAKTSLLCNALSREIYAFNIKDKMHIFYLQGKILELLYYELLPLNPKIQKDTTKFSSYDKNAIVKAKDILVASYDNPPTIRELAQMVHLNEFKLKFGFKMLYGTSIYKSVLERKMQKAKQLLIDDEMNISQVAHSLGYKHLSSFSLAFKKYFGISPKEIER